MVCAFAAFAWLLASVRGSGLCCIPDYGPWLDAVPDRLAARAQWVLGDVTEPQCYKSWPAAVGLLGGAALAWAAARGGRRERPPIAYGSGLWPWIAATAGASLVLSNVLVAPALRAGWQPTSVPFVSVAAAVVLVHGPGWKGPAAAAAQGFAQRGAQHEHAAADDVGHPSRGGQADGEAELVGGKHPLQLARRRAEIRLDGRPGDDHDVAVRDGHEHPGQGRGHGRPRDVRSRRRCVVDASSMRRRGVR